MRMALVPGAVTEVPIASTAAAAPKKPRAPRSKLNGDGQPASKARSRKAAATSAAAIKLEPDVAPAPTAGLSGPAKLIVKIGGEEQVMPASEAEAAAQHAVAMVDEASQQPPTPPSKPARKSRAKPRAKAVSGTPAAAMVGASSVAEPAVVKEEVKEEEAMADGAALGAQAASLTLQAQDLVPAKPAPKKRARKAAVEASALPAEGAAASAPAEAADVPQPKKRARKVPVVKAEPVSANEAPDAAGEGAKPPAKPRKSRAKKAVAEGEAAEEKPKDAKPRAPRKSRAKPRKPAAAGGEGDVPIADDEDVHVPVPVEAVAADPPKRKRGAMGRPDGSPAYEVPSFDYLPVALALKPAPLPVPNLGYACLNMTLRDQKPSIFTNRDCVKKTYEAKGLAGISALALENCRQLPALIKWNHENGIRFFRLTSCLFPWMTEYWPRDLPEYEEISRLLRFSGDLARALGQRLTFHPSHFVKLAAPDEELAAKSIHELEVHSQVFDMMGYEPSPWNKINIHIGGVYNDKPSTLARFAANFKRLSPGCAARLTIENDDWASAFSIADLLPLHKETGVPLVFDFHHHKFCTGDLTEREAFLAAVKTWPKGVRPVVHWSESQEGRKASAHSDYVEGPIMLHGLEADVDVMIEAKGKELALLRYRDGTARPQRADDAVAHTFL